MAILSRIAGTGLVYRNWQGSMPLLSCLPTSHPRKEPSRNSPITAMSHHPDLTRLRRDFHNHLLGISKTGQLSCSRNLHQQQNTDFDKQDNVAILSPRWIVETSPANVKPYLRLIRLDRPIGTWLVFLPCTWSLAMAASPGHLPDPRMLATFAVGSFLMRGAGCTINDMWDSRYDALVERTRDRPLACGQLSNLQALVFLGGQLSCALGILLTLNWYSVAVGACCMLPVIIYPLMKRFIHWPHLFLGVTLNWGVLVSWSAVQGHCHWPAVLPLYFSCVMFTTIYDIIYAHQDKEDDITAGVKSAALKLGDRSKPWLVSFASIMVSCLGVSGYMCDQTWPYYAGVSCVAAHLAHQIYTVDLQDREDCARKFRSNKALGLLFFAAIVAGTYLRPVKPDAEHENETKS